MEADVEVVCADVEVAKNEFEFVQTGIEVAKAELEYVVAQDLLRKIKVSFAGLVTPCNMDSGKLVSFRRDSGKPMLMIENVDVLRGVMTVPADVAARIRVGDLVTVTGFGDDANVQAPDGGKRKVNRLGQSLEIRTRTMQFEIDLTSNYDESIGRYQLLRGQYGFACVMAK